MRNNLVKVPCISISPIERAQRGDMKWFLLKTECIGEFDPKNGFDNFFMYKNEEAREAALTLAQERYQSAIRADNVRVPERVYKRYMKKVYRLESKLEQIKAEGRY